jgi:hypothetical protein
VFPELNDIRFPSLSLPKKPEFSDSVSIKTCAVSGGAGLMLGALDGLGLRELRDTGVSAADLGALSKAVILPCAVFATMAPMLLVTGLAVLRRRPEIASFAFPFVLALGLALFA